jgi:hypothetical protein
MIELLGPLAEWAWTWPSLGDLMVADLLQQPGAALFQKLLL